MPELELIVPSKHQLHRPPSYHPERPERMEIAISGLRESGFDLRMRHPEPRGAEILTKVHEGAYVDHVRRECERGPGYLDVETYVTEHSFEAALEAACCAYEAAESVAEGEWLAISLARPPGHHAGRSGRAMGCPTLGFCLFNNAALAASALLERGIRPVMILDFDLHHGNGTQDIFWYDPDVLHVDLHDAHEYPGTGWPEEVGEGAAAGTKVNVPLLPESGDEEYAFILGRVLPPLISHFRPRALIVSAGFDAHSGEGMGHLSLSSKLYRYMGGFLRELSEAEGMRIVVVLEGGYSSGLRLGLPSFIRGLCEGGEPIEGRLERGSRQHVMLMRLRDALERSLSGFTMDV
ncbi:MAG: histone deacetylase family protein [Candidatus Korarchaeota archaeon NZ13-K]|nr:MAG: histone deacetylase family protein [Candidatus Korarchaeota archaeon NZ13-K]